MYFDNYFNEFMSWQGGQILRMAISLSALLKKPVKIIKIRAGRKKDGLAAQHLNGIVSTLQKYGKLSI